MSIKEVALKLTQALQDRDMSTACEVTKQSCGWSLVLEVPVCGEYSWRSPLDLAVQLGNSQLCREMLSRINSVGVSSECFLSSLHYAIQAGQLRIVLLLLNAGAQAEQPDQWGIAPLSTAARHGRIDIWRLLMRRGASPFARDRKGNTAIQYAAKRIMDFPDELDDWHDAFVETGLGPADLMASCAHTVFAAAGEWAATRFASLSARHHLSNLAGLSTGPTRMRKSCFARGTTMPPPVRAELNF